MKRGTERLGPVLRAEVRLELGAVEHEPGPEAANVAVDDPRAVVELDHRALVARGLPAEAAGHAQVHEQPEAALEPQEQVLPAPLDRDDAVALELLGDLEQVVRPREPRVEDLDALERAPLEPWRELGAMLSSRPPGQLAAQLWTATRRRRRARMPGSGLGRRLVADLVGVEDGRDAAVGGLLVARVHLGEHLPSRRRPRRASRGRRRRPRGRSRRPSSAGPPPSSSAAMPSRERAEAVDDAVAGRLDLLHDRAPSEARRGRGRRPGRGSSARTPRAPSRRPAPARRVAGLPSTSMPRSESASSRAQASRTSSVKSGALVPGSSRPPRGPRARSRPRARAAGPCR